MTSSQPVDNLMSQSALFRGKLTRYTRTISCTAYCSALAPPGAVELAPLRLHAPGPPMVAACWTVGGRLSALPRRTGEGTGLPYAFTFVT